MVGIASSVTGIPTREAATSRKPMSITGAVMEGVSWSSSVVAMTVKNLSSKK
jgi:hypothetical protein